jgi:pyruvate formate lyase activating enzyme
MLGLSSWVASLEKKYNKNIPLHITRFFPRFHMTDKDPTPVAKILKLVEIAKQNLEYVFPGNI